MFLKMKRFFQHMLVRRTFHDVRGKCSPPHTLRVLPQIAEFPINRSQPTVLSTKSPHFPGNNILHGYKPSFRANKLGSEAIACMELNTAQDICYYPGKLHGGIQSFLLDQILADCCQPAVTASLNISFLKPIDPEKPIMLFARPVRIEGRKIYIEGSIKVRDEKTGALIDMTRANALFIHPA